MDTPSKEVNIMDYQNKIMTVGQVKEIIGRFPYVYFLNDQDDRHDDMEIVAIHWSGTDCDGYGISEICYTTPENIERYIDYTYKWADGPMVHRFISLEQVREYEANAKDILDSLRQGWDDDRF